MSKFSLKNGLKLSWAHLHDEQMFLAWMFFAAPGLMFYVNENLSIEIATICFIAYEIIFNSLYVLIRCWENPVKLGWCDK